MVIVMADSLADKKLGTYTVKEIKSACNKLYNLGIVPGARITVISNDRGPIIVRVGNCKLAMGRGMARSIIVE